MRICVLLAEEARQLEHHGVEYQCNSGRHHHYSRRRADELVKAGQAQWVGRHKRRIKFVEAMALAKVYERNSAGETIYCTMQLVRERAVPLRTPARRSASGRSGPVRRIAITVGAPA